MKAADAHAVTVVAGACVFTFQLTSTSPVPVLPPKGVSWTITHQSGSCHDSDTPTPSYAGTINGSLSSSTGKSAACAGGALTGDVTVNPSASLGPVEIAVTVAMAGPTLTLEGRNGTAFVGAGVFANTGAEVAECTSGGWDQTSWTGVFVFVDPTV